MLGGPAVRWMCEARAEGPSHDVCTEVVLARGVRVDEGSARRARATEPRYARRLSSVDSCASRDRERSTAHALCVEASFG